MKQDDIWKLRRMFEDQTQEEIADLFGFGSKTIHNYLSGKATPTTAHARYMQLVLHLPEAAKMLRYIRGRTIDTGKNPLD